MSEDILATGPVVESVEDLAKLLRQLRRRQAHRLKVPELTYRELAAKTGWSIGIIAGYLTGRTLPPTDRFDIFITLLGASPAEQGLLATLRDRVAESRRHPAAAPSRGEPGWPTPRQLPADVYRFSGRESALAELDSLLCGGPETTVVISALSGTAGVGKTALAVHWAHRVSPRFPDGQLYVNLRGFDATGPPLSPAEAVRGFLDAFGVQAQRVPTSEEAQIGLYRSIVADRRVLLLLDNARDAEQVRPLLPGSAHCLTVVTSRNRLASLVVTEGAQPLSLDLLSPAEAQQMLVSRLGEETVSQSPAAAGEVIERCARLPLALAIVSARVRANPGLTVTAVAKELRDTKGSLDLFAEEDGMADVRAVFSYSYNHLSEPVKDLFRLLGTQAGPDITADAAASLAGKESAAVRQLLTVLVRANLLTEHQPGRFTFHDLLRAYAREQAFAVDSEETRAAALRRCLDHYLHSAHQSSLMMYPQRDPITLMEPEPGAVVATFTDIDEARAWFADEHKALLAAVDHAAGSGLNGHAWQLAWAISDMLDWRGLWHQMVACQSTALVAARQAGDEMGMAHAYRLLGRAHMRLGHWDEAETLLQQAVRLLNGLGDAVGEASSHITLSRIHEQHGRMRAALSSSQQALKLFGEAGHRSGQARSLNTVGWYQALLGECEQAIESCEAAIDLHAEIGSRFGQAPAWDSLGYAHQRLGHHAEAVSCFDNAIRLYREVGDRYHEADTMIHLADSHASASAWELAAATYREALQTLVELNHPAAVDVRPKLKQVEEQLT
jgi:tetratricopeptide (TPR) repeat protein